MQEEMTVEVPQPKKKRVGSEAGGISRAHSRWHLMYRRFNEKCPICIVQGKAFVEGHQEEPPVGTVDLD